MAKEERESNTSPKKKWTRPQLIVLLSGKAEGGY